MIAKFPIKTTHTSNGGDRNKIQYYIAPSMKEVVDKMHEIIDELNKLNAPSHPK